MKGIFLAVVLLGAVVSIFWMIRLLQREVAKLQALILKGEQYHQGRADRTDRMSPAGR